MRVKLSLLTGTDYRYCRIPKVTAPVTFGFCRQKGPLLSGSRYFRIGKKCLSLEVVLDKEDMYYGITFRI